MKAPDMTARELIACIEVAAKERQCADLEIVAMSGSGCSPKARKEYTGHGPPSPAGDLCRLEARITYLEDIILCEQDPGTMQECCDQAYADYCAAHDACPL